jgi:hypothetical protein
MTTSGTGGYLFYATKVFPSEFMPESNSNWRNRKKPKTAKRATEEEGNGRASQRTEEEDDEIEEVLEVDEDVAMAE